MLADCLTKAMDGTVLRKALALGKYSFFDELDILKQRADLSEQENKIQNRNSPEL